VGLEIIKKNKMIILLGEIIMNQDVIDRYFKYKTEEYDIDQDEIQHRISIDNNSFGSICIEVLEKDKPIHTSLKLWFDRKTSLDIINKLIKCLADYPEDQKARIQNGFDCSCKTRIEHEAK